MTMVDLKRIGHWVNGAELHGTSGGRVSKVYNPATGEHTADLLERSRPSRRWGLCRVLG